MHKKPEFKVKIGDTEYTVRLLKTVDFALYGGKNKVPTLASYSNKVARHLNLTGAELKKFDKNCTELLKEANML